MPLLYVAFRSKLIASVSLQPPYWQMWLSGMIASDA